MKCRHLRPLDPPVLSRSTGNVVESLTTLKLLNQGSKGLPMADFGADSCGMQGRFGRSSHIYPGGQVRVEVPHPSFLYILNTLPLI